MSSTRVVRCLTNRDGWSNQWKKRMSSPMVTAPKVGHHWHQPLNTNKKPLGFHVMESLIANKGISAALIVCIVFYLNLVSHIQKPCHLQLPHLMPAQDYPHTLPLARFQLPRISNSKQPSKRNSGHTKKPPKRNGKITPIIFRRLRWHCHFIQKLEDEPQLEFYSLHPMMRDLDTPPFN